jgi:aerobic carbon-monoxide dehydrogenase large subunit
VVLRSLVGAPVKRKEDPRLITGSSIYVDDLSLPGMAHVAIVRSPHAHATITEIDSADALAMPGVVAVVTAQDLTTVLTSKYPVEEYEGPGGKPELQISDVDEDSKIPVPGIEPLARSTVRYIGEPVAAVVAESKMQAHDAAAAVQVNYEPLPVVVDPYEARQPGAPLLYDTLKDNISVREQTQHGDVDAAIASAVIKVKAKIRAPRCHPMPMETRGVVAAPDPITRGLTVWVSNQGPHGFRNEIASAFGLAQNQVRAIAPEVGGGFGCKFGAYHEDYVAAALALLLRRPIKWIETRSEHFLSTNHGRNQWGEFEAGVDRDGRIQGLRGRVLLDSGAYPKDLSLAWCTWVMATGPYEIPNLDYMVEGVYTNTGANGAYRGAGRPEATFYLERLMDIIADEAGLDPATVRRVNFITPDKFPYTTHTREQYDTGEYEKPLDRALELVDYPRLRQEQAELRAQGRYIGIGLASYVEICGFGPWESATVRVEPGGEVTIFTGISPHGQGQETTFAQLAADYIGADFDRVIVHHGDTGNTPHGNGTGGSRGLAVGGAALVLSLNQVRGKAQRIAAHMLEAAPEDIELVDGTYRVRGVPAGGLTLEEIAPAAYGDSLPVEIDAGLESTDFFKPADETFPFGTHVAVVEVFPETGEVKLLRYVSVDDCGNIISPMLVTGQVHGGVAQGIGLVLWEELLYDDSGELLTGTLNDYAIPKADGFPAFETHHTTTTTPINPLGAKGIGEAATIGATPTVANAVIDALSAFGITHLDIPFTPEKIWMAIRDAQARQHAAD